MNAEERRALKLVTRRAHEVTVVLGNRDRLGPSRLRPAMLGCSNDWAALYTSLSAKGRVPESVSPNGPEAQHLCDSLFPDGVSFMQLDARTAWVEAHRRIERIEAEHLAHELDHLIGSEFLAAVKRSTEALANLLGTGKEKRTIPGSAALAEAIARFGRAVGAYGRTLAYRVDEEDEASVKRFLAAMAPLDEHRERMRAGGVPADDSAPADPTPAPSPTTTSSGSTSAPAPTSAPTSNGSTPSPSVTPGGDAQTA